MLLFLVLLNQRDQFGENLSRNLFLKLSTRFYNSGLDFPKAMF